MKYDLSKIPHSRSGDPIGPVNGAETSLRTLLIDAIECAHLGTRGSNGQPVGPESLKSFNERNRLLDRLGEDDVELSTEERTLLDKCVTAHFHSKTALAVLRYLDGVE